MKNKILTVLSLIALGLLGFTVTAHAATAALPADGSLGDMAKPIFDAVMGGHWFLGAALALVFLCTVAKRYGGSRFPFLNTDVGGAVLVLVGSFGGAIVTGLAAVGTDAFSWSVMYSAGTFALVAAGGYSLIKKLLVEPLMASVWYQTKAPSWLKAVMSLATWIFTKPADAALATATAAGQAAVDAKPAIGFESKIGKPEGL